MLDATLLLMNKSQKNVAHYIFVHEQTHKDRRTTSHVVLLFMKNIKRLNKTSRYIVVHEQTTLKVEYRSTLNYC